MSSIRFVHSDYWRLAESIAGLASAPEWLRRQARDATRDSVVSLLNLASTHHVDFVFVGGRCTDDTAFSTSVADWLSEPLGLLRRQGIQIVMAESRIPAMDSLADVVVRPGERLHAGRLDGRVRLTTSHPSEEIHSDLAISAGDCGPSRLALVNYLYSPQLRHEIARPDHSVPVYSAGATQAHGPTETGRFGCLVVDVEPQQNAVNTEFHSTDTVQFESRTMEAVASNGHQEICERLVEESRALARQVSQTTVVDWRINTPVTCPDTVEFLRSEQILDAVRAAMQTGHLGVWPRRVAVCLPNLRLAGDIDDFGPGTLKTLLLDETVSTGRSTQVGFEQLVTSVRLLNRAA